MCAALVTTLAPVRAISKDEIESLLHMTRAEAKAYRNPALDGNVTAQLHFAFMHLHGLADYPPSTKDAAIFFRKAAQKGGNAVAQFFYGVLSELGLGTPKNSEEAYQMYRKHEQQDPEKLKFNLGDVKDDVEAVREYEKLANTGNTEAQFKLGFCYDMGLGGLQRNDEEAARWYRKAAANKKHLRAQFQLGVLALGGRGGMKKGEDEAYEWFKGPARKSDAKSEFYMGLFYKFGLARHRSDDATADNWFRKAYKHGFKEAYMFMTPVKKAHQVNHDEEVTVGYHKEL